MSSSLSGSVLVSSLRRTGDVEGDTAMKLVPRGRLRDNDGRSTMGRLRASVTMSLDGFVAGPHQSLEDPLGVGGMRLHEWIFPLKAFREGHGETGGEVNA